MKGNKMPVDVICNDTLVNGTLQSYISAQAFQLRHQNKKQITPLQSSGTQGTMLLQQYDDRLISFRCN